MKATLPVVPGKAAWRLTTAACLWASIPRMNASEIRAHLTRLQMERIEADAAGLTSCEAYMADLDDEISLCRAAFVGAAVTEIAVARGELSGRQTG